MTPNPINAFKITNYNNKHTNHTKIHVSKHLGCLGFVGCLGCLGFVPPIPRRQSKFPSGGKSM